MMHSYEICNNSKHYKCTKWTKFIKIVAFCNFLVTFVFILRGILYLCGINLKYAMSWTSCFLRRMTMGYSSKRRQKFIDGFCNGHLRTECSYRLQAEALNSDNDDIAQSADSWTASEWQHKIAVYFARSTDDGATSKRIKSKCPEGIKRNIIRMVMADLKRKQHDKE